MAILQYLQTVTIKRHSHMSSYKNQFDKDREIAKQLQHQDHYLHQQRFQNHQNRCNVRNGINSRGNNSSIPGYQPFITKTQQGEIRGSGGTYYNRSRSKSPSRNCHIKDLDRNNVNVIHDLNASRNLASKHNFNASRNLINRNFDPHTPQRVNQLSNLNAVNTLSAKGISLQKKKDSQTMTFNQNAYNSQNNQNINYANQISINNSYQSNNTFKGAQQSNFSNSIQSQKVNFNFTNSNGNLFNQNLNYANSNCNSFNQNCPNDNSISHNQFNGNSNANLFNQNYSNGNSFNQNYSNGNSFNPNYCNPIFQQSQSTFFSPLFQQSQGAFSQYQNYIFNWIDPPSFYAQNNGSELVNNQNNFYNSSFTQKQQNYQFMNNQFLQNNNSQGYFYPQLDYQQPNVNSFDQIYQNTTNLNGNYNNAFMNSYNIQNPENQYLYLKNNLNKDFSLPQSTQNFDNLIFGEDSSNSPIMIQLKKIQQLNYGISSFINQSSRSKNISQQYGQHKILQFQPRWENNIVNRYYRNQRHDSPKNVIKRYERNQKRDFQKCSTSQYEQNQRPKSQKNIIQFIIKQKNKSRSKLIRGKQNNHPINSNKKVVNKRQLKKSQLENNQNCCTCNKKTRLIKNETKRISSQLLNLKRQEQSQQKQFITGPFEISWKEKPITVYYEVQFINNDYEVAQHYGVEQAQTKNKDKNKQNEKLFLNLLKQKGVSLIIKGQSKFQTYPESQDMKKKIKYQLEQKYPIIQNIHLNQNKKKQEKYQNSVSTAVSYSSICKSMELKPMVVSLGTEFCKVQGRLQNVKLRYVYPLMLLFETDPDSNQSNYKYSYSYYDGNRVWDLKIWNQYGEVMFKNILQVGPKPQRRKLNLNKKFSIGKFQIQCYQKWLDSPCQCKFYGLPEIALEHIKNGRKDQAIKSLCKYQAKPFDFKEISVSEPYYFTVQIDTFYVEEYKPQVELGHLKFVKDLMINSGMKVVRLGKGLVQVLAFMINPWKW